MAKKPVLICDIINDVRRVFHVVHEVSKKAKQKTGLTSPQLWAIKSISESANIKVSDLACRMYLHPATVVGILNRLEKMNLIRRSRQDADRRVVRISLTSAGKKLVKKSPEVAQGLLVAGLETLTVKRLENLSRGLGDLVGILGAQEIPPRLILSREVNVPNNKSLGRKLRGIAGS